MQYDRYREKVKRVASILGRMYTLRFVILIALVAMTLTVSVLVATKGLLVLPSECPAEMTYGDRLSFHPVFLTAKTRYEYRPEGEQTWQEGTPVYPGAYTVRAYGKKAFGGRTYTEAYDLRVLPREISLSLAETTVEYGDTPRVKANNLARGDTLSCGVRYAGYGTSAMSARPDLSTLSITDQNGAERRDCYLVTGAEFVSLRIIPRRLTVTVEDASKVYDDTALSFDGYEISGGSLLAGDQLVAVFRDTLIDAGTKTNTPELKVYNGDGRDVTEFYDITVRSGKLTVEKRPLIVQAGSVSFVYDGQSRSYPQYFVDESTSLVNGHYLEVRVATSIQDCGTVPNVLTFAVHNRMGGDETRNYSLFVKEGSLTVTPRSVNIYTQGAQLVYDGTDQSYPYVTVDNGVGDEYRAVNPTTLRDVGYADNRMTVEFYRDGKNITSNYIINSYTYGTLEITPRPLSVQMNNSEKIYDGTPLTAGGFLVNANRYPLPKGHTLTLDATGQVIFGTVPHKYVYGSARVTDGSGKDVTKNYEISITNGTLTVKPRPLTLSTLNAVKVYDGTPLSKPGFGIASGSLLSDHELSAVSSNVSITEVGTAVNTLERQLTRIYSKKTGEDVSQFYDVTYSEGILEIQGRPITVHTESRTWMYDAAAHSGRPSYSCDGDLLPGHIAETVSADSVIVNAGSVPNEVVIRIMNRGQDVTHNYKITYDYGTLTVTKRPITVRAGSLTVTYDGKPHAATGLTLSPDSPYPLASPDHALSIRSGNAPTFTEAGSYLNTPSVSVYDQATGVYVTSNYDITCYDGTVTIEKRPLHLQINGEKVYDGTAMDTEDYRIDCLNGTTLASGHTVNARPESLHTGDAGSMVSVIMKSSLMIQDGSGKDVHKNYAVSYYTGTLTVTRRPVSLVTATAEKVYDGLPLRDYTLKLAPNSLPMVEGHEPVLVVNGSQTAVGQSPNICVQDSFCVRSSTGVDVTKNYRLVSVTEGTLTVKHDATVTVTTGSDEKVYDGLPLTCNEYTVTVTEGTLPTGYGVYVTVTGLQTRPGSTPNTATVTIRDETGTDVTHLFTVNLRTGVLTVTENLSGDAVFGSVRSDISGRFYLRMTSYGSYNGKGWEPAPPYGSTLSDGSGLHLLPAAALKTLGLADRATLSFSGMSITMLPYYTAIGGSAPVVGNDTDNTAVPYDSYTATAYLVEEPLTLLSYFYQLPASLRPYILGSYASAEQAYRTFVHGQYLTLDEETRAFMQTVIDKEGFDLSDPSVIGDVAAYIRSAAVYSLQYDPALDEADNVAIAFLRDYREGVCVHYATAATLLYRALGIPARYTTGFMMELEAGEWTEIRSPGHAWVEVYVDGLGWIQVEVTGSETPDVPVDPPVIPPDTQKPELELIPVFAHKVYDGDYLYATSELVLTPSLEALLKLGYTYTAEVSGNRLDVGDGISVVSHFVLYDPDGRNVTEQYRLVKKNGLIRVTAAAAEILLYPLNKTYDGSPALWGEGDYAVLSLPDGVTLTLTVTIPADILGCVSLSELNRNVKAYAVWRMTKNGVDVTDRYTLVFSLPEGSEEMPVLTVTPRFLELTAASETRVDDGTTLVNATVYVTKGSLAQGHTLETEAVGERTGVGTAVNRVNTASTVIRDGAGNDVTHLYRITTREGTLTLVTPSD